MFCKQDGNGGIGIPEGSEDMPRKSIVRSPDVRTKLCIYFLKDNTKNLSVKNTEAGEKKTYRKITFRIKK